MSSLADRIKDRMKAMGLNNAQLAAACGVKPPTSFNWASGKTQSIKGEPLLRAAKALGVTPDWLATGLGPMTEEKHWPGGFYETESPTIGIGATFHDDEVQIMQMTECNPELRQKWLYEARAFHSRRGTMTSPSVIEQGLAFTARMAAPVSYLPERKTDPLNEELLHLFSQLDDASKREYLAHLRGFVAGRRPHPNGDAPAVAG